jgi:hypothetical protein
LVNSALLAALCIGAHGFKTAFNLYAGVLLLAKEVLRQLSPSGSNVVLIFLKTRDIKGADGQTCAVGLRQNNNGDATKDMQLKLSCSHCSEGSACSDVVKEPLDAHFQWEPYMAIKDGVSRHWMTAPSVRGELT